MSTFRQAIARGVAAVPRSSSARLAFNSPSRSLTTSSSLRQASSPSASSTPPLDTGEQAIYSKLRDAFSPARLEVQDVSGGCGSFYAIEISSTKFKGLGMVKQQKLVNEVLKDELKEIHGIQVCNREISGLA